ncbi:hypothetical protein [Streptosporangium sp. CA-115845]|uniref:hypothetical protein n=1 Tax=Streptosporangium sp. CA-115845 TaxID=3240071 RepID=UPI003D937411
MEVLVAFIREHSRDVETDEEENVKPRGPGLRTDLQATLTVIGRRAVAHDTPGARIDLTRANLTDAHIVGVVGLQLAPEVTAPPEGPETGL